MNSSKLLGAFTLASLLVTSPFSAPAKETPADAAKPAAETTPVGEKPVKEKPVPYNGTVSALDASKQSFTFKEAKGERTFMVVPSTKIENTATKQPAKFEDIAMGAYLTGSYLKKGEVLEAYSVHLGKTAPVKAAKKGDKAGPSSTPMSPLVPAPAPAKP